MNIKNIKVDNNLISFLIELTTKSDHPYIPILSLQILCGIESLPDSLSADKCLECGIACVEMAIPCCQKGYKSSIPFEF